MKQTNLLTLLDPASETSDAYHDIFIYVYIPTHIHSYISLVIKIMIIINICNKIEKKIVPLLIIISSSERKRTYNYIIPDVTLPKNHSSIKKNSRRSSWIKNEEASTASKAEDNE